MGFWRSLFSSDSSSEGTVRVRQSNKNTDHIRGDKYEHTGGREHTHRSYDVNTSTGEYREYTGGEKSSDRSYNK